MTTKARISTRQRLLDAAEQLVNRQGFSATSIDQIIDQVGITKGAFFYHFKSKAELARALIDRFAAADQQVLYTNIKRAESLSDDPLQQLLIFVGLLLEIAEQLDSNPEPGCLFATYCYEQGLFDEQTHEVIRSAILDWRTMMVEKLRATAKCHKPTVDVNLDSLADMLTVLFEGAFVLSRSLKGKDTFVQQIRHYRHYLQLLFQS